MPPILPPYEVTNRVKQFVFSIGKFKVIPYQTGVCTKRQTIL